MRQPHTHHPLIIVALFLWAAALAVVSCGTTKQGQKAAKAVTIDFNADSAMAFCAAQCQFGPRTMNSEAHEACGQWISKKFQEYNYRVQLQQASLRGWDGTMLQSTNIMALAPGRSDVQQPASDTATVTDRTASGNTGNRGRILICAHWDSRPWADNDPDEANWHSPVMAANDGASGVGVMLELARLLSQHDSASVEVDFCCFDAEDWGVPQWSDEVDGDSWALGAQHWARHYVPSERPYDYAILLDMVGGQGAQFYREGFSMQHARSVVERVWQAASAAGYGSSFVSKTGSYVTDDHVPLNEVAHIPTIDIISYYPDCPQSSFGPTWHTVSDDMSHLDINTLQAVGQTLVQLIFQ